MLAYADYSLFINCGGSRIGFEGNEYEDDQTNRGPAYFFSSSEKWAYTSSGVFIGKDDANYVTSSASSNLTGGEIYRTARQAPASLKYYGLCLRKGSYKVRLHFAEIMYSDDKKFSSLGRRIFDVSIQVRKYQQLISGFSISRSLKSVSLRNLLG